MSAASAREMQLNGTQAKSVSGFRWKYVLAVLLAVLIGGALALGLWPARADFAGDEGTAGVAFGGGGLRKPFPAMVLRADNPLSPEPAADKRVALGRLLFFDPILSGENNISCATCHHPDLGFTDGRGESMGKGGHGLGPDRKGGEVVRRSAPTLWNAAYNHLQFWDGRAADLEEQAEGPIKNEIEMAEDPENLVKELKQIPEYAKLFDAAFGGQNGANISLGNVAKAIAAFERTLTANNSPFDRFVAGERNALTLSQKRGFNLFRSGKTRCFECHGLPTFANRDFKIIGAPDLDASKPDYGRYDVTHGEGNKRAFKVPPLRNVVLNAPYMHNGRFKTLEEVLDFYAGGGGTGLGLDVPNIDDKIRKYTITPEEKADLIAFLYSLVDESHAPAFPDRVPSGLPVVGRLNNPARELVAKHNVGSPKEEGPARGPMTLTVKPGESIQAAVERAQPGDTIEVLPGVYNEEITIDLDNITLRGVGASNAARAATSTTRDLSELKKLLENAQGSRPVLDGKNTLADAVIATGDNFHIEGFEIRDYTGNGVVVQNASGPVFRDLRIDHTGLYGTYPVSCTGVTIERVVATGIADAAIYCGQSRDIVVRNCEARDNVTGIEIENSVNAVVESNYVHNNTGGILVFVLPNNPSKIGRNCRVVNNWVHDNNHANFGDPNSIVSHVPPGTGVMIMAADDNEVTGNEIRGNDCYGVAVFSLELAFPKGTSFDVGPVPERNWVHDNTYADNGRNPAGTLARAGLKGADLLWDLSGWSNKWSETNATRATPLLSASWPELARRAYWRVLTFAQEYL
ncbi:MAG TPA: parallel beta-helix domain-containing protein [Blastocatellia bacterium]|nr:parallel beta-helix domain-containing protein [Blastocatellia bacterium]